jgi:uncharacterized protein YndB with AHSA1/START domain
VRSGERELSSGEPARSGEPDATAPSDGIVAEGVVRASPSAVFDYLSALEHHWQLTDHRIEVLGLSTAPGAPANAPFDRGTVRMRGPLGIGRVARTQVESAERPRAMSGSATLSGGTRARVDWTLTPADGGGTRVRLSAELASLSVLDRALLAFGGRAWMRRMFAGALERLDRVFTGAKGAG